MLLTLGVAGDSDCDGCLFKLGIGHLTCYGTFPYQGVEAFFAVGSVDGCLVDIRWTDCLVGFLRSFAGGVEVARMGVTLSQ
ncbi:unknown [Prevotella sp. CAG:1031]|nr:unknown [Prevotella sp. CAG:1031]